MSGKYSMFSFQCDVGRWNLSAFLVINRYTGIVPLCGRYIRMLQTLSWTCFGVF